MTTKTAKQLATQLATLCHEEQMTLLGFAETLGPAGQELALAMVRELVAAEELAAASRPAPQPRAPRRTKAVRLAEEKERFLIFAQTRQGDAMGDYLSQVFAREGSPGIQARWDWAWESEQDLRDEPALVTEITQWSREWLPLLEFDW